MIFVSYSWDDRPKADELSCLLSQADLEYWLDSERLALDRDISAQILAAVRDASGVLVLDSPSSRTSPWVQFETALAYLFGKPLWRVEVTHAARRKKPWRPLGLAGSPLVAAIQAGARRG